MSCSPATRRAGPSTGCLRSTATCSASGVWELLWAEDVPDGVAVSEAMALVRDLSTDESPAFVNGILGAIQRDKPSLV